MATSYRSFDVRPLEERRKAVARTLEAQAVRLNHFDNQPGQAGLEHDEVKSGQEEIYIPLKGAGVLRVDGEQTALEPGVYVLVEPGATRQVLAGAEGLSYAVVGAARDRSERRPA